MNDRIIGENFIIDLTNVKNSITEENPRFKDTFWSLYSLPFDIYVNRDIISTMGNYSSLHAVGLKRFHDVIHIFEGRIRKAKLEILDITDPLVKVQLNSGFEDLPNFEKKLSELPFDKIIVADIYNHANEIVNKKYPDVNYNFPKLITDEYDLNSQQWKYFDGLINNRTTPRTGGAKVFPRNEVIDGFDVANRNIIHPLPYLLYVLKVGFQDAGFILQGDIITDPILLQRTIYSGSKYYSTGDQKEVKLIITDEDYTGSYPTANYSKQIPISAPGKYRFKGRFLKAANETVKIYKNNTLLRDVQGDGVIEFNDLEINISIEEAIKTAIIKIEFAGQYHNNEYDNEGKNIGVAQIQINPIRQHSDNGDPIPFVFNENAVDIARALPEWTFGELVTAIKNLRNYDLIFDGSVVYMNRINIQPNDDVIDFRGFEIEKPTRKFTDKQSFLIKFPETDGEVSEDIFFDENGYQIGKKGNETTTEVSINVYPVKVKTYRAIATAKPVPDGSMLQLVYYDGLNSTGDNHAKNPTGLSGKEIAEDLKTWYINRVTNNGFTWSFLVEKNKIRNVNIRSEIYAYGRRLWIKQIVKNSISATSYQVEITTEGMD
ncbi:hypothetical protein [Elizabethkingia anophelis]|uniref:hypothetical protein n=1 Tax=Elizabethkingia anophelis TaxID=1117645 RepID=UPI0024E1B812|nr:hypothetical protein [Elizabethkingia anophelis]MCT4162138.1 hypothetical protein [Elizabethkingia anophelis]CAH1144042.1 hypothetical protein EAVNVB490_01606 [Elizabethkingia anophelis]CAI9670529.1 hypothetical protein EAVNNN508_01605 [Elizabethkingia anophelis]CAI9673195.1 hypothetical protein EAVNVB490_00557 [Elizabethkingia anophelis]CAI9678099.1 hypothetical protein EAVNNN508_00555 [Elizabethkingia anophelis]